MKSPAYRYPVRRGDQPRRDFPNVEKFFERRTDLHDARLCQVMFRIPSAKPQLDKDTGEILEWPGFPWLTPVLGSGCLDLPAEASYAPDRLARVIAEDVKRLVPSSSVIGGSALPSRVSKFTLDLLTSRSPKDYEPGQDAKDPKLDDVAVRLVIVATLLTRFFYISRARSSSALSRWDDETAEFSPNAEEADRPLMESPNQLAALALDLIGATRRDLHPRRRTDKVAAAVYKLLGEIASGLDEAEYDAEPRRLKLSDLRLISDVAWYYLIHGSKIYPGWTDLLLRLMLREGTASRSSGRARPRELTIRQLPDAVRDLLEDVTKRSFESAERDPSSVRDRLYAGVADVLWAQCDARTRADLNEEQIRELPPATAFVTSFDIELDMAMWRSAEGRTFSVAIPVHVTATLNSRDAAFCWLLADVDPTREVAPDEQLRLLRENLSNWRLITPKMHPDDFKAHPIIVHLNGAPLFTAASLENGANAGLRAQLAAVGVEDTLVSHAVTVDEYLALRQSAAELFWTAGQMEHSRALHQDLTLDTKTIPRFWLALGVPMDDAAVRNRFASQITLSWVRDHAFTREAQADPAAKPAARARKGGGLGERRSPPKADTGDKSADAPRADVFGVAVNTRMSADETGLMNWLGLDVVNAECQEFTGELHHYAAHVRETGEAKRPPIDEPCELDSGDEA